MPLNNGSLNILPLRSFISIVLVPPDILRTCKFDWYFATVVRRLVVSCAVSLSTSAELYYLETSHVNIEAK